MNATTDINTLTTEDHLEAANAELCRLLTGYQVTSEVQAALIRAIEHVGLAYDGLNHRQ